MGKVFQAANNHITHIASGSVFVEIGSDRYEGSTLELDSLAGKFSTRLISVDITDQAQQRLSSHCPNTDFVIDKGSKWAQNYQGPGIACLYLDNFDYIWDVRDQTNQSILQQKQQYLERGETMSNQNSQIEHMRQIIYLNEFLDPDALVMFDDTYKINDCWVGKCGPAVIFLLAQGWYVKERTTDCGVILKRS